VVRRKQGPNNRKLIRFNVTVESVSYCVTGTVLPQQTNDQNIPNNVPITKSFNRSTKASQSITTIVLINQATNVTLATQPRAASKPAKSLCSAKGIILGCMESCQAARNGGCRPNNLCCTLSHSQKDQWPCCVTQKPKESLSCTDIN